MQVEDDKPDYTLGEILTKILLSRGGSREKYGKKVTKFRRAWPEDLSPEQLNFINNGLKKGILYSFLISEDNDRPESAATLTKKQKDIISMINWYSINKYNGISDGDISTFIDRIWEDFFNDIKKAVRLELIWHPIVYDFVFTYVAFGNKEVIRKIRRGWEKSVKRPIKESDLLLYNYLDKIDEYRADGKSWRVIRRILMKRRIIGNISVQALKKKVAKYAPHLIQSSGKD
jgi:hypothetical protein